MCVYFVSTACQRAVKSTCVRSANNMKSQHTSKRTLERQHYVGHQCLVLQAHRLPGQGG